MVQQQNAGRCLDDTEIYDVLSNERRRLALRYLREEGGEMTLRDLAERIAEAETEDQPPMRKNVQSVYVTLHQTHLPKLADLGIVDYQDKTVSLTDRAEEIRAPLETVGGTSSFWNGIYILLSVSGVLFMAGSFAGLPGFGAIPPVAWAAIHIVLIGGIAAYRTLSRRRSILERTCYD